jgi:tetratricopeptide (TPR) repeat protein
LRHALSVTSCSKVGVPIGTCPAKVNPQSAYAFQHRGNAWNKMGEYDNAIADYSEAIRLNPQDPDAFSSRGHALNSKGEHGKAVADFEQATKLILVVWWRRS